MYKVLIIDDNSDVCLCVQDSLATLTGWETLIACSGKDGLVLAQKEQPDAILLDLALPGIEGRIVLQYLRNHPDTQSIPVILFTGLIAEPDPQLSHELSVSGIIAKPVEATQLVRQMCNLLSWGEH
ncbi:response regulator [Pantanalinema sp. GBBB05]|uniref:response regulator n=1 Tax=Pantanalinema sp. GBBB05 TaxID=2604139 RepID=UPI001DF1A5E9|nr:response regulator [Pantanalinema sp. GBBB05]